LNGQVLLLFNNALVPWFIVLPNTDEIELFRLEKTERALLETNIDLISALLVNHFETDKVNVASIGNVVSQMHIHVVGRHKNDPCWPGVVWGNSQKSLYQPSEVENIRQLVSREFEAQFICPDN
jgi:diadenosine tetraphosphate (Ap4A) HIT family hydrolase